MIDRNKAAILLVMTVLALPAAPSEACFSIVVGKDASTDGGVLVGHNEDDYPPQVHVHRYGLTETVTPVISTAQVIRTARILRMMALALGEPVEEYEQEIDRLSYALHAHAWDGEAGYFGYVCHDEEGRATGILRTGEGVNFNMGMDGASPLVAGICTPEQEARLVNALMSPERMWTPYGLSTVDQSAPYYRDDGYWNGAVWICLLYTSPSPRDRTRSRMPSSA